MKKSHLFNDEFFETHSMDKNPIWGAVPDDWHGFNDEEVKWFEERGCEIVKVECPPGSLVIWDSRAVHWNVLPEGKQTRAVVCKCPQLFSQYLSSILSSMESIRGFLDDQDLSRLPRIHLVIQRILKYQSFLDYTNLTNNQNSHQNNYTNISEY